MQNIRLGAQETRRQPYDRAAGSRNSSGDAIRSFWRIPLLTSLIFCVCTMLLADTARAQGSRSREGANAPNHVQLDRDFIIPKGEIEKGDGRRVLLKSDEGYLTVGRIYVEGDKRYLITLPNGSLMSVTKEEVALTDRPFQPQTAEEMEEALLETTFEGFQSKRTKRYIYFYECSDTFFKAANMQLETMRPKVVTYCKKLGLDVQEQEFPMVVVIFGDRRSFNGFKPIPRGVAAYYSLISNYIVMHEDPELTRIAPKFALKTSVSTIAHEGVHQILGNVGIQKRFARWPIWIQEGFPEYCATTEIGSRIRYRGVGLMNNIQMFTLMQYKKIHDRRRMKGKWMDVEMMSQRPTLDALGYAHAWGMTYGLAKSRKTKDKLGEFLREVSQLGPLETPPKPGYYFNKHFSKKHRDTSDIVIKELSNAAKRKYKSPF